MQKRIPKRSSLWPSIPFKKVTDDRSGNFKFASPPTDSGAGCCAKTAALQASTAAVLAANFPHLLLKLEREFRIPIRISWSPIFANLRACKPNRVPTFFLRMKTP
jgi:hypothetical protein